MRKEIAMGTEEVSSDRLGEILRAVYRPFESPREVARCFAGTARRATGGRWARVTLARTDGEGPLEVEAHEGESGGPRAGADGSGSLRYPVRYQDTELGSLTLPGPGPHPEAEQAARMLARHLMRLRVARQALREYRRDVALVGASRALGEVDRFLEAASRSSLPALLVGPIGSEVERLGLALHLLGPAASRPFVQVHCGLVEESEQGRSWADLFRRAAGGTLLLAHLEDLAPREQHRLVQILEAGEVEGRLAGHQPAPPRLVVSVRDDVASRIESGALSDRLVAVLEVLRVELPPLRCRREDVAPLLEHFLRRHADPANPVGLSEETVAACVAHDWPGDRLELGRTVARMALTGGASPRLEVRHLRRALAGAGFGAGDPAPDPDHDPLGDEGTEGLVARAEGLHPSVRRAVQVIVQDEGGGLKLSEVAAAAHVSPSHLSHLFRRELETSFTHVMTAVRVERAKRLLRRDPWLTISAVASRAGFRHVRQLERAFQRVAGCTPSGYRLRVRRGKRRRSS